MTDIDVIFMNLGTSNIEVAGNRFSRIDPFSLSYVKEKLLAELESRSEPLSDTEDYVSMTNIRQLFEEDTND